jgi:hypothetical protein
MSEQPDPVQRARDLLAKITPGPWEMRPRGSDPTSTSASVHSGHRSILTSADGYHYGYADTRDAEFIAAAPQLVAELADKLSEVRQIIAEDDARGAIPDFITLGKIRAALEADHG